ncbi:MAG: DUF2807 domain-containing protein [Puia sp.]
MLLHPHTKSIEVSGSSDIVGQTRITSTDDLSLEASGAGDIKMEVDAPKITAGISGTGSVDLKGQAKDLEINLTGAGHAYCYDPPDRKYVNRYIRGGERTGLCKCQADG